jgi:hypothetical protein
MISSIITRVESHLRERKKEGKEIMRTRRREGRRKEKIIFVHTVCI